MVILDHLCPKSGRGRRESQRDALRAGPDLLLLALKSVEGKCGQLLEVKGKEMDSPVEAQKRRQPADPLDLLTPGRPTWGF